VSYERPPLNAVNFTWVGQSAGDLPEGEKNWPWQTVFYGGTSSSFASGALGTLGANAVAGTANATAISPTSLHTYWTLDAAASRALVNPLATRATTPLSSRHHPCVASPVGTHAYTQLVGIPSHQAIAVLQHLPGPIDVFLASTPSAFASDATQARSPRVLVFSVFLSDVILLKRQPLIQVTEPAKLVGLYQDGREWRVVEDVRLQTLYTRQPLEVVYAEEAQNQQIQVLSQKVALMRAQLYEAGVR
jgi:hypothetical protein